jgi:hypothetical protein
MTHNVGMERNNLLKLNSLTDKELEDLLNEKGIPQLLGELKISREWLYTRLRTSGYRKSVKYEVGIKSLAVPKRKRAPKAAINAK